MQLLLDELKNIPIGPALPLRLTGSLGGLG
jgi:hypothetical protein